MPVSFLTSWTNFKLAQLIKEQADFCLLFFCSLSNRIGEDQFPASKMKWGIFLNMDTVNAPQQAEITDITCVVAKNQGNDIQSEMD